MKRGDIYRDSQYTYPAGNVEDKFLIVLNKLHLPSQPIIVTPCTTNKAGRKYNPGCNHRSTIFLFEARQDFFENETIVQLYIVDSIAEETFIEKKNKEIIQYFATLRTENLNRLVKCVTELKDDITGALHQYLF